MLADEGREGRWGWGYVRPVNMTMVTKVPCSDSNRSSNGVKAIKFVTVCINPAQHPSH